MSVNYVALMGNVDEKPEIKNLLTLSLSSESI